MSEKQPEPTTEELIKEWRARDWQERFENGET